MGRSPVVAVGVSHRGSRGGPSGLGNTGDAACPRFLGSPKPGPPRTLQLTQELSADSGHTEGQQDVCDATYSVRVSKHRAKLCTSLQQATDSARAAGAQA